MRRLRRNTTIGSIIFRQISGTPSRCVVSLRSYRAADDKRKAREGNLAGFDPL
jgi:hypothetical protein